MLNHSAPSKVEIEFIDVTIVSFDFYATTMVENWTNEHDF
jgi:hypothetical protein